MGIRCGACGHVAPGGEPHASSRSEGAMGRAILRAFVLADASK
jgi:hypothetical protein